MEFNLEQYLQRIDMVMKPYALIINPLDNEIMDNMPDTIKNRLKIIESPMVEKGKAYIVDREHLENYIKTPSFIDPYYREGGDE